MSGELVGQVAIVTGGGRGIGRAIAQAFAAAGAAVVVSARSADQLAETVASIEQAGGRALAAPADVSDAEAVARLVAETDRAFGPVDVLVNNAGATGTLGPLWEVDSIEWWQTVEVNTRGPFLCARAVLPEMLARRRGRIINVASRAATFANPHMSAYFTSKTALARLTEVLALETREFGVCVFAIDPGGVRTVLTDTAFGSPAGRRWAPGFAEFLEQNNPTPEKAVALCLLLASGAADALTGRFLSVGEDLAALVRRAEEIHEHELYTLRLRI